MISRCHSHDLIRRVARAEPRETAHPVLATIWSAEGSTPLETGARALFGPSGLLAGTVGGGAAEVEVSRLALDLLGRDTPRFLECDLQGPGGEQPDPICGGRLRVLLQPVTREVHDAFTLAADALAHRRRGLIETTLVPGVVPITAATRWVDAAHLESFPPALRRAAEACLARAKPQRESVAESTGRTTEVLWEPVVSKPTLLIIGGGHVGQALAAQAVLVGFEIVVLDERPDFLEPDAFPPDTRFLTAPLRDAIDQFPFADDTYVAVMTRGHLFDAEAIAACFGRPAAYLGMIGSRRKVALLRDRLLASGQATPDEWNRVHSPIGLDLGALTAPEIAATIVAELVAVRRRGVSPRLWNPLPPSP